MVAEQGISAPTSRIAKQAGVAEGTVFKYFINKEQLFNVLYVTLKTEIAQALLLDYPSQASLKTKVSHIWTNYIDWAVEHAQKRKAMQQLGVWHLLSEDSRQQTQQVFSEINTLLAAFVDTDRGLMPDFIIAVMTTLAETTVDFVLNNPEQASNYSSLGFDSFWHAINHK